MAVPVLNPSEVSDILRKLGFEVVRQRGSHLQFRDTRGRCTTVSAHKGRDIAPPLLRQIAMEIGMTVEEFLSFFAEPGLSHVPAAQLQQLIALGVAQLCCCAEAFGYAAHQAVGALFAAGDAVPVSTLDTVR